MLNQAKQLNIPGRSRMTKGELVEALKSKSKKRK
ncbi:MAG: Rho termination factor N-terminal domain-containing protein [Clostridiales bacterium]